jgi:two-component sensor histidine kinase
MFKNVSLTFKMLLFTVIVGLATWSVLDPLHTRNISEAFHTELSDKLHEDAHENRLHIDLYLQAFHLMARLITSQKEFYDFIENASNEKWSSPPETAGPVVYTYKPPQWMPGLSVLRMLPRFKYSLLLDKDGIMREAYMNAPGPIPAAFLKPSSFLLQLSHQQNLMTTINDKPYLLTSESLHDSQDNLVASLLLITSIDNDFLINCFELHYSQYMSALATGKPPRIIASNMPDLLPVGTQLELLKDKYVYAGKDFFDYGGSDLRMQFITFVHKNQYRLLSESILSKERINRVITGLLLILSFLGLMVWITRRVQKLTNKVMDFSKKTLDIKKQVSDKGDELTILEDHFHNLSNEVVSSHEELEMRIEKRSEEIARRKRAEEQVKASLKEKEVLLKEIHHRVKNNMAVITSLLSLQSSNIKDKQYKDIFNNSINRIKSMALIHEKLYRSDDLAKVNFEDYLQEMLHNMLMSYGLNTHNIALITEVANISLRIDAAIPFGLIINELVSNSLKYAFPEDRKGEIKVAIRSNDRGDVELTISDNGVGMPEDVDFRKTASLGLNLVNALVGQLQGKIELYREKGTEFIIMLKGITV